MAKSRTRKKAGIVPAVFIPCTIRTLPPADAIAAAKTAVDHNPANLPPVTRLPAVLAALVGEPQHLALLTTRYWGSKGVNLTVGFVETTADALKARILSHMNAWGAFANIVFSLTQTSPQVRISRGPGGYWSYLGTDVLHIPAGQPTMNLQGFTMSTPESEYVRVVRHETGHTAGFPHEHLRRELVQRLDVNKTIAYFGQTQGWSPTEVRQQVLTPLEDSQLTTLEGADQDSIMCYQLPAQITLDGQPIRGGADIDAADIRLASKVYPKANDPGTPPPPPPVVAGTRTIVVTGGTITLDGKAV